GRGWQGSFPVADGQASWWNCPACRGWHVVVVQPGRQPGSQHDPVTLVQGMEPLKPAMSAPGMSLSGSHQFEISPTRAGRH
ncbi:MAG: hypothetical protein R3264_17345, partial [Anaerolineae bacterium]|nr:hypothetical protein [Anaerolineae bacterium]